MIEHLKLDNVGPAPAMALDFATRVNLLTGDNGLGKSFLLDVVWWALTRRWPREVNRRMTSGHPARPHSDSGPSTIRYGLGYRLGRDLKYADNKASFSRSDQVWLWEARGQPAFEGLVVYAHADGSFSVWDFARNYWLQRSESGHYENRPPYVFTEAEVWDGLRHTVDGRSVPVCNGLLYDWSRWIQAKDDNAKSMASVLRALSPGQGPGHVLKPGSPIRISVDDARDIPSIKTEYAGQVPVIHASSGIRRIVALAYMLTWSWSEHRIASELRGNAPSRQVIMLFDEVESHLHPRWQRSILRALRDVGSVLAGDVNLQLVISTHSPLVLASAEPWFDPEQDAWFDLDLEGDPPRAKLHRRTYTPHGTAGSWLTSDAFHLATDRSLEAEQAVLRARDILRQSEPSLDDVMDVHGDLRSTLPDVDRFWVRWNAFVESRGGTP